MNPENIQALTPLFLGGIGGAIGLIIVLSPNVTGDKASLGFALSGSFVTGAFALSQNKSNDSASIRANNVSVDSIQKKEES